MNNNDQIYIKPTHARDKSYLTISSIKLHTENDCYCENLKKACNHVKYASSELNTERVANNPSIKLNAVRQEIQHCKIVL